MLMLSGSVALGQIKEKHSDKRLTSIFKTFYQIDIEQAHQMLPSIKDSLLKELQDTNSFHNPYDSLSKHITIKHSSDNLLKLYCWNERNRGCRWAFSSYAQFKTQSNEIKIINLEEIGTNFDEDLYVLDLQKIDIKKEPHYLFIGTGGHCGDHTYQIAKIYKISNDSLVICDSIFGNNSQIDAGTHRSGKIEMKYSAATKILSYNYYELDDSTGFYSRDKKAIIKWKLTKDGFKKIN